MARRERTTALPRPRPRAVKRDAGRRFAGIEWTESRLRALIIGGAGLLLIAVLGALGWRIYDQQVRRPEQVVLSVGDEQVRLKYYADRLLPWLQENGQSGQSTSVLEDALLSKLEEEALTLAIASERGITITDDDVNQGIAESLGIQQATSGGSFDTLYRQKLDELKMSDSSYRRMTRASVAHDKVIDSIKQEIGDKGEQLELRTIVVDSKEKADEILGRIQGGEDMGTIAQSESNDLESRQKDGIMTPQPESLLPESVRGAVQGKGAGELLGPVQVETNWWVFRIERREEMPYTEGQKDQLAQDRLDQLIANQRLKTQPKRSLDADDIAWAEDQVS
ncbi:MAG: SurA N-terminal domain-containing protein [Hyphomicrobiales bacterium]